MCYNALLLCLKSGVRQKNVGRPRIGPFRSFSVRLINVSSSYLIIFILKFIIFESYNLNNNEPFSILIYMISR